MRTVALGGLGDPAYDPTSPVAYPVDGQVGLLGEMPVRLRAEGQTLVAYGVAGQRIEIPAREIRQVWIHPEFEPTAGGRVRAALLVLDARHRIVLRVPGVWGPGVPDVCHRLGLNKQPVVLGPLAASRRVTTLTAADGCQQLRVRRRGSRLDQTAATIGQSALCLGGLIGGVLLGLALPMSVGDVRTLAAIALGPIGALAGVWLYNAGTRFSAGLIRWTVATRRAGSPAPVGPFLRVSGASVWTERGASAVLALAVPVLAIWGATALAVTLSSNGSLSHGAAMSNIIAGALALLIAPLLARKAGRRIMAARHRVGDEFTSNLA